MQALRSPPLCPTLVGNAALSFQPQEMRDLEPDPPPLCVQQHGSVKARLPQHNERLKTLPAGPKICPYCHLKHDRGRVEQTVSPAQPEEGRNRAGQEGDASLPIHHGVATHEAGTGDGGRQRRRPPPKSRQQGTKGQGRVGSGEKPQSGHVLFQTPLSVLPQLHQVGQKDKDASSPGLPLRVVLLGSLLTALNTRVEKVMTDSQTAEDSKKAQLLNETGHFAFLTYDRAGKVYSPMPNIAPCKPAPLPSLTTSCADSSGRRARLCGRTSHGPL